MSKQSTKPESRPEIVPLASAIDFLRREYNRPLFVPPTGWKVPMRHCALAKLLGGETTPGIPSGCYIEVVGAAHSGKTSLTMAMADAVLNQPPGTRPILTSEGLKEYPLPRKVGIIDTEQVFSLDYARSAIPNVVVAETDAKGKIINAGKANLYVHQPNTADEALDVAMALMETGEFGLIVVDSVAALLARAEHDKSMGENTMGELARTMSKFFRKSAHLVRKFGPTVVLVNQFREKIGVAFGDPRVTPGGKAAEYYDAIKLEVSGRRDTRYFDDGKQAVIKCKKNKITGLIRECQYELGHGVGISAEAELLDDAIACGLVSATTAGRPVTMKVNGKDHKWANALAFIRWARGAPLSAAILRRQIEKRIVPRAVTPKSAHPKASFGDE